MPDTVIARVNYSLVTASKMALVNRLVNRDTTYVTDQDQYGVPEYWAVAKGKGDCEDYALAKLKELRADGFPQESLDIGICKVEGQGHAVLIVHTDQGDMVLDSNHDDITRWSDPEYQWIETSVAGSFLNWK